MVTSLEKDGNESNGDGRCTNTKRVESVEYRIRFLVSIGF
jgi:hypothetical protein